MMGYFKTALIVLATLLLVALFLRHANLSMVAAELRHANLAYVGLAFLATVGTFVFRAWRWQYLLAPIGHAGFGNAFRTTVIGFGANGLLPGRVGEVLRPYLLARREGFDPTAAFATIVLERALDLITLLCLFALSVSVFDPGFSVKDAQTLRAVHFGAAMAGGAAAAGLVVAFLLAGHAERVAGWTGVLTRWMPPRLGALATRLVSAFGQGFSVLRAPRALIPALGWSMAVWVSIAVTTWAMARAFDLDLAPAGTFAVLMFLAVGVAVPTPGAVGGFHEAVRLSMVTLFGADNDVSVAMAVALHALAFLPVSAAGIYFMAREGLSLSRVRALVEEGSHVA
jgi:uncharacterized membrane protein YbhN (UPF0104 family)